MEKYLSVENMYVLMCIHVFRKLMWSKKWDSSYVGFTTDGADWLVNNTDVKFVGEQSCKVVVLRFCLRV